MAIVKRRNLINVKFRNISEEEVTGENTIINTFIEASPIGAGVVPGHAVSNWVRYFADTETFESSESGRTGTFFIANLNEAISTYGNFYVTGIQCRTVSSDCRVTINDKVVWLGKSSGLGLVRSINVNHALREGANEIKVYNGPGGWNHTRKWRMVGPFFKQP